MRRIPALDGLRAVAVALVVASHLDLNGLGGGWIGVDMFFVLSGHLITSLLRAEQARDGQIKMGAFYVRRAARLYPALILMVGIAAVLGIHDMGVTALIALTYTQDLVWLVHGSGVASVGHTWSLAIEEHFYLLWPLVLYYARSRRTAGTIAIGAATASFLAAFLTPGTIRSYVPAGYFMLHTHAGPILAGCALAFTPTLSERRGVAATWSGAVILAVLVPVTDHVSRDQAFASESLAVTLATLLLIAGLTNNGISLPSRFLSTLSLTWTGQISYGIYLFHAPIIQALSSAVPGRRIVVAAELTALSVAVAAFSYHLVERRILDAVRQQLSADTQSLQVPETVYQTR